MATTAPIASTGTTTRSAWDRGLRVAKTPPGVLYVVVLFLVLASLRNPYFGSTTNFREILIASSVLGVLACGTTVLLICGLIDFAIGAEISLVTVVAANMLVDGHSTTSVVVVAMLVGIATSAAQGLLVMIFNVTPFIVSLGATTAYLGLALNLSGGRPVSIGLEFTGLGLGDTAGVPNLVWVLIVVAVIFTLLMRCTRFGVYAYAIGGSARAAFLAGVRVRRFTLLAYTVSGVTVGLAGIMLMARSGTGSATLGTGYELQAIAAAVIGGTSFSGGRGTVFGAVLGVVLLTAIDNLLALSNISGGTRELITGLIVVIAAVVDCVRSGKLRLASTVA